MALPLEQVASFTGGFAFKATEFSDCADGKIGVIRTTNLEDGNISEEGMVWVDPDAAADGYLVKSGKILLGMSGSIKLAVNTSKETYFLNQRVGMFEPNDLVLPQFLFFFLSSRLTKLEDASRGNAVINLSSKDVLALTVLVPSLEKQREIVGILDKFYSIVSNLETGLPAEIQMCHQRYEYYQDILLSW